MSTDASAANLIARPVLQVRGLARKYYRSPAPWRRGNLVAAASEIEFEIFAGQTLGLVGNSGSGKSTVARCVARLEQPDAGEIWLDGTDIAPLTGKRLRRIRSQVQLLFQDAVTSMNPRMSAAEIIEEPLLIQRRGDRIERRARVLELMSEVGIPSQWADRLATDFSGGQRQRLAIARALALKPRLLVLDEAFTGLDLSTEAQIANLLLHLQSVHSLAFLLISHDLSLVVHLADRLAVMSGGRIVESGAAREVIGSPKHPQTQALVASARTAQSNLAAVLGTLS
jgi:peptide/nickel transport system ATP-binding protein